MCTQSMNYAKHKTARLDPLWQGLADTRDAQLNPGISRTADFAHIMKKTYTFCTEFESDPKKEP